MSWQCRRQRIGGVVSGRGNASVADGGGAR